MVSSKKFTDFVIRGTYTSEQIFPKYQRCLKTVIGNEKKFADLHFENTNLYNFVRNVRGLAIRGGRQITRYIH